MLRIGSARLIPSLCFVTAVLFVAPVRAQQVFTAGPDGAFGTIQAALDTAGAMSGDNEVRVEAGTYIENVSVWSPSGGGVVTVTGGWDASFTSRVTDASATVIDGNTSASCLYVTLDYGSLVLDGLTFTRGSHDGSGGAYLQLSGSAAAEVRSCRFVDNEVSFQGPSGGGFYASLFDNARLTVQDSAFVGNTLSAIGGSSANGAGLSVGAQGDAQVTIARNVFSDNQASSEENQVTGVGLFLLVIGNATAEVTDNVFARNLATTTPSHGSPGEGAALWADDQAQLTAQRNTFLANGSTTGTDSEQVSLTAYGNSSLSFTDSLVAAAEGSLTGGVRATRTDTATLVVTNATIADNPNIGIFANAAGGTLPITNSIIFFNGRNTNLRNGAALFSTLVSGDPMFVDRSHRDYRLRGGSPAIDAGDDSPSGGLSATDLAGAARETGAHVDQGAFEYSQVISTVPVVIHAFGYAQTPWRSSLTAVNAATAGASTGFDLSFFESGTETELSSSLPGTHTDSFGDVVVSPLGFPDSEQHAGALWIIAHSPGMTFSSRTFADPGGGGTYGQFLAAIGEDDLLAEGETAIVPLVRSDDGFYANVGMVNGWDSSCSARVRLFDASGAQVGTTQTMTAAPWAWAQISDVFAKAGVSDTSVAYALVDVTTIGGKAWFYGSVVDRTTRDPTTVPMQRAVPAGTVLRLPAAAHVSGVGGTPWRTTLGIVNGGTGTATVTLVYRSGSTTVTRTVTIPAGGVQGWDDLLVGLFGYTSADTTSGSVEITADQPLAVAGRSYADMGVGGTYGQFLPALDVGRDGTGSLVPGVVAQVRKDSAFYTNVGFQNLGREACDVRVTLFGLDGTQLGSAVPRTVAGGAWQQINDVFAATGAADSSVAYAVVEVLTAGGRVWAYASVVDSTSHDPTTVPLARPWVIGPPIT